MKILFINPPSRDMEIWVREGRCQQFDIWGAPFPPLTLAYLKTQAKDIAETLVLDPGPAKMSHTQTLQAVNDFKPDMMIMSVTTPTFNDDCNWFAGKVKEIFPDIIIGAVGIHVMSLPKESLRNAQSLDFVFISEAEAVIKQLSLNFLNKGRLSEVKGIGYKDLEGKIIINERVKFNENLDDYGMPDWSDIDFQNYKLPIKNRPFSLISFSRGCPYACAYCAAQTYYGRKLRKRSIENIIKEIYYNLEIGVKDFLFWTELISADRKYLDDFLNALFAEGLDKKINWVCNSRVDQLESEQFVKMEKAGCWQIAFGLEFGTDKMLKIANKGGQATTGRGKRAVVEADEAGLIVDGHFIMGYPKETKEDIKETIEFAVSLPLTFAHFYTATPFPGSALYEKIAENYQSVDLWNKMSQDQYILNDLDCSKEDVQQKINEAYKRFYLSPRRAFKIYRVARGFMEKLNLIKLGINFAWDILKK